jgi:hypothetical protein
MPAEEPAPKSVLEIHEEFLQHVEAGSAKIKTLSLVTIVVAGLLAVSYVYQMASAYLSNVKVVAVDLTDPALIAVELVLTALALVWLYVGLRDYIFVTKLARSVGRARLLEKQIEREISSGNAKGT